MTGTISEIDVVRLLNPIIAKVMGDGRDQPIPAGAIGTVVLVYDGAYEIEFVLTATDEYALATVAATDVVLHEQMSAK